MVVQEETTEGIGMAISRRMLALIQKIEAADAEHLARLRERAKRDAEARELAKAKKAQAAKGKRSGA